MEKILKIEIFLKRKRTDTLLSYEKRGKGLSAPAPGARGVFIKSFLSASEARPLAGHAEKDPCLRGKEPKNT